MLNFIAIDLQLYKIFKIMRVSFFLGHTVVIIIVLDNKNSHYCQVIIQLKESLMRQLLPTFCSLS